MAIDLSELFNGISVSSILLLMALGLAITFGLMKIINMAHGELMMIGSYVTYVTQKWFTEPWLAHYQGIYLFVAIVFAFIVSGLVGYGMEVVLIRRLYQRPLDSLLATWGVSLILQQLARNIFGAPNVAVVAPQWLEGGVTVMPGLVLPYSRIFIIALVCLCFIGLVFYFGFTRQGRRMRAVMQNRQMAACLGISTRRMDAWTFALGSGLAGIAGSALTLLGPIGPSIGTHYIVDAFMVVVAGGVGTLIGTIAGALGIGMSNTLLEFFTNPSIGKVLVFTLVIVFLQWKPAGLFDLKTRSLD
ncbi:urea ABC transporter permease subunit UrtB [Fodinisporobacter ferrooxydans]|uniref:Urea ABC transporter permease subunit UrtB n=1 Tax=Fodinisporobacter ferrooxydans TaxID=2901836 RepID=A0ABY4CEY4_9BACL|nr:urea ABC transporter permease subunit UrtB [Alicyclobacillaceae bacterium MYW30-H2]